MESATSPAWRASSTGHDLGGVDHELTLRRWVPLVAAGEWLGFLAPAVAGSVAAAAGVAAWPFYLAMVAAGAVEGLVLGVAQGTALRRAAVPVSRARWTLLTSAAAAGA